MKSNFEQETIFIALSNVKSLEILTCNVIWAALGIDKNICFHFTIGIMEKSIEFILGHKRLWLFMVIHQVVHQRKEENQKQGKKQLMLMSLYYENIG